MNNNEYGAVHQFQDALAWVMQAYPQHRQPQWLTILDWHARSDSPAINFDIVLTIGERDTKGEVFRYRAKETYNIFRDDQETIRNKVLKMWINLLRFRNNELEKRTTQA